MWGPRLCSSRDGLMLARTIALKGTIACRRFVGGRVPRAVNVVAKLVIVISSAVGI